MERSGAEWSGVERSGAEWGRVGRSGAEWSIVEWGGGGLSLDLRRGRKHVGYNVEVFKLKRDRV